MSREQVMDFYNNDSNLPFEMSFGQNGKTVGTMRFIGGEMKFEGEADSSASVFIDMIVKKQSAQWEEATSRISELEAKCAALAAETHGFKRFFMFAINAAFDGCDITGDQIQEVAKEIGLVRVEPYSAEKHAYMSGDPSIMEEGDDFYIMNKTPATDAFLAEVRAQGVEMFAKEMHADISEADALEFAAQLRQDANTAELVAAGIITKVGE